MKKIIIKRIISVTAFALGMVIILLSLSIFFMPKNNTSEYGMEYMGANGILAEEVNTIDAVVLGDSETYSSISPMEIWNSKGYTTYVCGSGGQTLDYTLKLLHRAVENQSPKVVILETNAIFRKVSLPKTMMSKLADSFPVFQYHDSWKRMFKVNFAKHADYTWTDYNKGFKYSTKIDASNKTDYMKPTTTSAIIAPTNKYFVEEISNICKKNDIKLILLSTPSTKNWNYSKHNAIEEMSKNLNVEYIDLNLKNDDLKINWKKDTKDKGDHLNFNGAKKVTRFLSNYLEETKLLTDHRNDKKYENWKTDYDLYQKDIVK